MIRVVSQNEMVPRVEMRVLVEVVFVVIEVVSDWRWGARW